jgi:hypothetical protein
MLIVFGYVVGITAHLGYDVLDSVVWVARLPRAVCRIGVLVLLFLIYQWFWRAPVNYPSSFGLT